MGTLSMEGWISALEEQAEIDHAVADFSLVSDPSEPIRPEMQEVIAVAIDTVSNSNSGVDNPKAVVISTEAYSFENMMETLKNGAKRLMAFIGRLVQKVLDFIKSLDGHVRDGLDSISQIRENTWKRIDEFMGREPVKDAVSKNEPQGPALAVAIGSKQAETFDDVVKAYETYLTQIPFQFKLLERDADLINDLFGVVSMFGLTKWEEGLAELRKALQSHESAVSRQQVESHSEMFGGITVTLAGRPGNPGAEDNEIVEWLTNVKAIDITRTEVPRKQLVLPETRTLRDLVRLTEKVGKYFIDKKENFTGYAEDQLKHAENLTKALDRVKESIGEDNRQAHACVILGQKVLAVQTWLISRYANAGTTFFKIGRTSVLQVDEYMKELVKMAGVEKSEEDESAEEKN